MELTIERTYGVNGTNGKLYLDGKLIGDTIELPWRENRRRISCIPEGRYRIKRRFSEKFNWHCYVESVTGRDGILIHAFNNALKESKGCIAPVTKVEGPGTGSLSRAALARLMHLLASAFDRRQPVFLTIKKQKDEDNKG